MRAILLLVGGLSLASCSGIHYALENYSGVEVQEHVVVPTEGPRYIEQPNGVRVDRAAHFRIFDKPTENRLMITASIGDAAAIGLVKGATFGIADSDAPEVVYRNAAQDFLDKSGRSCAVADISLIATPQYEVRYACKAAD
ncbi:hypothetical protein [Breoghania sp.]|uniref:hypothetical protein n=1 Tax=Breoghania sp. TaxID=2065378 RepID=UPI002AA64BC9|nr:hypothetical protein [Breoghania sp.]